jgi:hypothetical protein
MAKSNLSPECRLSPEISALARIQTKEPKPRAKQNQVCLYYWVPFGLAE